MEHPRQIKWTGSSHTSAAGQNHTRAHHSPITTAARHPNKRSLPEILHVKVRYTYVRTFILSTIPQWRYHGISTHRSTAKLRSASQEPFWCAARGRRYYLSHPHTRTTISSRLVAY